MCMEKPEQRIFPHKLHADNTPGTSSAEAHRRMLSKCRSAESDGCPCTRRAYILCAPGEPIYSVHPAA
ncbi:hypothetical protein FKM82_011266 [Ascaphus truei]